MTNMETYSAWAIKIIGLTIVCGSLTGCHSVMKPKDSGSEATTVSSEGFNTSEELVQQLNICVEASAQSIEAVPLSSLIERQTLGRLIGKGQVVKPEQADLLVALAVKQTLFDKSGEFIVLEGEVDGSVTRLYDKRRLAYDRLSARGKREMGMDKAVTSLANELSPSINAWIDKSFAAENIPISACVVNVRRTWMTTFTPGSELNARYAASFVKTVSRMPGVLRCELVEEEPNDRRLSFRIVYLKEKYPFGLLNAVILANKDLRLKR